MKLKRDLACFFLNFLLQNLLGLGIQTFNIVLNKNLNKKKCLADY